MLVRFHGGPLHGRDIEIPNELVRDLVFIPVENGMEMARYIVGAGNAFFTRFIRADHAEVVAHKIIYEMAPGPGQDSEWE